ncbi:hypothetical protein TNCV_2553051 [Trichonephila clavipes]|nr:hypothetical protein TNCV_2553051 [Trichonephila clavipes]
MYDDKYDAAQMTTHSCFILQVEANSKSVSCNGTIIEQHRGLRSYVRMHFDTSCHVPSEVETFLQNCVQFRASNSHRQTTLGVKGRSISIRMSTAQEVLPIMGTGILDTFSACSVLRVEI